MFDGLDRACDIGVGGKPIKELPLEPVVGVSGGLGDGGFVALGLCRRNGGEGMDDLTPFQAEAFVDGLLGNDLILEIKPT